MVISRMETVGLEIRQYKGRLEKQLEKARDSLDIVDNNLKRFSAANNTIARLPPSRRQDHYDTGSDKRKDANFDQTNIWNNVKDSSDDLRNNIRRRRLEKGYEDMQDGTVPIKRKLGTNPKVLQCSISGPPVVADYESEDETTRKPVVSSYVIAKPIVIPSRKEAASVKLSRETRARDKRMFGALLGTLKKFRQEETQLKEKVDKKAQVEKKLEDAAIQEKERIREDKVKLMKARRDRELYIEEVECHLAKVKSHEEWEEYQKPLFNYIKTSTDPPIYYSPALHCEETEEKLKQSQAELNETIEKERQEIKREVDKILEKWNIENLETIPEIFLNQQLQQDVNGSYTPVFENIHATVTVKPQKSPLPSDDESDSGGGGGGGRIIKAEDKIKDGILSIGDVRIKVEKPDKDENFDYAVESPQSSINIKQERDNAIKVDDKTIFSGNSSSSSSSNGGSTEVVKNCASTDAANNIIEHKKREHFDDENNTGDTTNDQNNCDHNIAVNQNSQNSSSPEDVSEEIVTKDEINVDYEKKVVEIKEKIDQEKIITKSDKKVRRRVQKKKHRLSKIKSGGHAINNNDDDDDDSKKRKKRKRHSTSDSSSDGDSSSTEDRDKKKTKTTDKRKKRAARRRRRHRRNDSSSDSSSSSTSSSDSSSDSTSTSDDSSTSTSTSGTDGASSDNSAAASNSEGKVVNKSKKMISPDDKGSSVK